MLLKKFCWHFDVRRLTITGSIIIVAALAILPFVTEKRVRYLPCQIHPSAHDPCRFNQDNSGLPFRDEIVPNIVHFYRSGNDANHITFVDAVCLLAAFWIINPDRIFIHTEDVLAVTHSFSKSQYGRRIMQVPGFKEVLDVRYWPVPKHVFGIAFASNYRISHIADVTRLRILRKYGGILLDNHAFVLQNPAQLRHYEMSLFDDQGTVSDKYLIGHRDARILDLWLKSYHGYDPLVVVHHLTDRVQSIFLQKSTLFHRFENGIRQGDVNVFSDLSELQRQPNGCHVVYINVPDLKELSFDDEDVVSIVEKQMQRIPIT